MVDLNKRKRIAVNPGNDRSHGCTIFTVSYGEKVFFGNNEDWLNWNSFIWFDAGENDNGAGHGVVCVGFGVRAFYKKFPQGALNEKGLCHDWNGLPSVPLVRGSEPDDPSQKSFIMRIMRECSSVDEAIDMFQSQYPLDYITAQIHFADSGGEAVVISGGPDGKLAFTRKEKGNTYLISTNFNRANPDNADRGYFPCWRYNKTDNLLKKIKHKEDLNVDYVKSILKATHLESTTYNTIYSNIFDLQHRTIYLYYFHQFDEVVKLDLAEELAKGSRIIKISELFSQKTVNDASREYKSYTSRFSSYV